MARKKTLLSPRRLRQTSEPRPHAVNIALALGIVFLSALAPSVRAQTYKVLYDFTGGSDGAFPLYGTLAQDQASNLYGTTYEGGSSNCGTVFKVVPKTGKESVLHNFTCGSDGGYPHANLILSGNTLYGTTPNGGSKSYGVVFEVNIKTGAETVLYNFAGGGDGAKPWAELVQDKAGNLYGTTTGGGSSSYGTVFQVVPKTKKETVLHSFSGSDGEAPFSGLALDPTGKVLYGTTYEGGSSGSGVVFGLTIKTRTYTVLHNFTGGADGGEPFGTLDIGKGGILYGTTEYGGSGSNGGNGVVYELVFKTGNETVLYTFSGGADGGYPFGGVIPNKAGKLCGTTQTGGAYSLYGTIFELDPTKGTETVLHSFDGTDGAEPLVGLLQDSHGTFYGTTYVGGTGNCGFTACGVVFSLHP